MAVSPATDARIRAALGDHLRGAEEVLCGVEFTVESPWQPRAGSAAASDIVLTVPLPQMSGLPVEIAPVLQWSRTFALDAAQRVMALGNIVVAPPWTRDAEIDPVARAAAESALWARWLVEPDEPMTRLARALLVDVAGAESHVSYFARIGHGDIALARAYVAAVHEEARQLFGEFERARAGRVTGLAGESLPSATGLFRKYLPDAAPEATGSGVYGELSVQAHPVAHAALWSGDAFRFDHGQAVAEYGRDLHDEGRILSPAVAGFTIAAAHVRDHFGADYAGVERWGYCAGEIENKWCAANGCRRA